jgi:mannose-binding lectin 2
MAMFGLSLVVVLCVLCMAFSERMEQFTFKAPFEDTDVSGTRVVGNNWKTSGTTVVNKNFIRLTPDRQSKKGSIWSKKTLSVSSFSTVIQFRISGQGKNFFGDGIALWVTQNSYHVDGIIHGSAEKFVGIGVIFDTFKNTENLAAHRDVTVLINNGDKTYEMMTKDVMGCAAKVRYHAERADFSVTDSSRAKVVVQGKT